MPAKSQFLTGIFIVMANRRSTRATINYPFSNEPERNIHGKIIMQMVLINQAVPDLNK
jgi:hypothetical protein